MSSQNLLKDKSIVTIDKQKFDRIRSYVNLIRKSFECSICIDYYVEPVITNCQHTFCKSCIENYIGSKRFQNCPLCKASINLRSLKSFDSLNSYVALSKTLAGSFEADEADNQKLDPIAIKDMFSKMVEKFHSMAESPPEQLSLEELEPNIIQPTNNDEVTPTTPLQKRKRSISGEQNVSSKKAKQNLQRPENTAVTSGLREIAVNRVPSVATTINRLAETPALRANQEKTSTTRLHVVEHSHSKSSINIVKLTTSTNLLPDAHGVANKPDFQTRSPRASRLDESNKENMAQHAGATSKTPVTPNRRITDQPNNQSASKTDIGGSKVKLRLPTISYFRREFQMKTINPLKFKKESSEILVEPNFTNKNKLDFEKSEPRADETKGNKESPSNRRSPRIGQVPLKLVEIQHPAPDPLPLAPLDQFEYPKDNDVTNVVNETAFPDFDLPTVVQATVQAFEQAEKNFSPEKIQEMSKKLKSPRPIPIKIQIPFIKLGQLAKTQKRIGQDESLNEQVARKEFKEASVQTESIDQATFSKDAITELNLSILEREIFETTFYDVVEIQLVDQAIRERLAMFERYLAQPLNEEAPQTHSSDETHQATSLYVPISTMPTLEPSEPSHNVNESVCEPTVLLTGSSSNLSKSNATSDADSRAKTSNSSSEGKGTTSRQFIEILNTNAMNRPPASASAQLKSFKSRFSLSGNKKRTMPALEFLDANKTYAGSQFDESFAPSSYRIKTSKPAINNVVANRTLLNETSEPEKRSTAQKTNPGASLDVTINTSTNVYQLGQRINDSICEELGSPDRSKNNEQAHQSLLIITDTPNKASDDALQEYFEHDESLSKTAARGEFALGISLNDTFVDENRTMRNRTLDATTTEAVTVTPLGTRPTSMDGDSNRKQELDRNSKSRTVINETVDQDEDGPVRDEPEAATSKTNMKTTEPSRLEFSMPLPATAVKDTGKHHESFLLNSFNVTASLENDSPPLLPTLATSSIQSDASRPKNARLTVPNAQDILGTSFAHSDTTFSSSGENQPKSTGSKSSDSSVLVNQTMTLDTTSVIQADQSSIVVFATDGPFFATQSKSPGMVKPNSEPKAGSKLIPTNHQISLNAESVNINRRLEFVCSLLKADMKANVKKLAEMFNAKVANEVTASTTHLIVESDERLLCGVTSKYLKAVSRKIWIISGKWVLECLQRTEITNPLPYEIRGDGIFGEHLGPHRSRTSPSDSFLFSTFEILFMEKFDTESINLAELTELAMLNGACIVKKAKEFSELKVRVVLLDEKVPRITVKNANLMYEKAKIHCLTVSWFLDSLACFSIKEFEPYALYKLSS